MIKWKVGILGSGFLRNGQHLSVFVYANDIQVVYKFIEEYHHRLPDNLVEGVQAK